MSEDEAARFETFRRVRADAVDLGAELHFRRMGVPGREIWVLRIGDVWREDLVDLTFADDDEDATYRLMNAVQDYVVEEFRRPWPPCPHPSGHPMFPALIEGRAVWVCGSDVSVQVGLRGGPR